MNKKMKKIVFLSLSVLGFSVQASPNTAYTMDLKLANQLATSVMESCAKQTKPAAVVILDQGGNVLVSQRHETVGPHNLTAAQRKAFTAYSTKTSTLQFMRNAQKNPDSYNLTSLPELLLLGGGMPVIYKDQLLGAVGVAGSGGSVQDDQCAQQGIQAVLNQI